MRIVWAIDVFETEAATLRKMAAFLRRFGGAKALVEPVYVSSHAESRLTTAFDVPEETRFTDHPRALLADLLGKARADTAEPTVVFVPSPSQKPSVTRLLDYARSQKADLLAVSTHSRGAAKRFFLGSFAEAVLTASPIPVLLMPARAEPPHSIRRVLYATDLSPTAQRAFRKVLPLVESARSVVVFHVEPYGFEMLRLREKAPRQASPEAAARRDLGLYERAAVKRGLTCDIVVEKSKSGPAARIAAATARHGADVVAVAEESGAARWALLGSVTRQLIRASDRPVLVVKA